MGGRRGMVEAVVDRGYTAGAGDGVARRVRRIEVLSLSHVVGGLLPVWRLVMMSV